MLKKENRTTAATATANREGAWLITAPTSNPPALPPTEALVHA